MAPSTSWWEPAGCVHAATITTVEKTTATRRSTAIRLRGRDGQIRSPSIGQLTLQLWRRRVPVVDVQGVAVGGHDHRRRQRVDVEAIRQRAFRDGIDPVYAHARELRERRLLVRAAN